MQVRSVCQSSTRAFHARPRIGRLAEEPILERFWKGESRQGAVQGQLIRSSPRWTGGVVGGAYRFRNPTWRVEMRPRKAEVEHSGGASVGMEWCWVCVPAVAAPRRRRTTLSAAVVVAAAGMWWASTTYVLARAG